MNGNQKRNLSVLLVDPIYPGNVGSAARALSNMGLRRLKLVNPPNLTDKQCRMMAGHAWRIVTDAEVHESFEEACADEGILVGATSVRGRRVRRRVYSPRELAPRILESAEPQRVALIFGSEREGLGEDHLAKCQFLVSIPSDPEFPTLNLAQSVLVLCYELMAADAEASRGPAPVLAGFQEREAMLRQMEQVLIDIGFLSSGNPAHIMNSIRRLLGSADLTSRDVRILRGIFSQMEWFVREGGRLPEGKARKP